MALRITQIQTFTETVSVTRPGEERPVSFKVEFKHLDATAFDRMMQDLKDEKITNADIVREVAVNFPDIQDGNGVPVTKDVALEYIVKNLDLTSAVTTRFVECLHGSREKNSKASRRG